MRKKKCAKCRQAFPPEFFTSMYFSIRRGEWVRDPYCNHCRKMMRLSSKQQKRERVEKLKEMVRSGDKRDAIILRNKLYGQNKL